MNALNNNVNIKIIFRGNDVINEKIIDKIIDKLLKYLFIIRIGNIINNINI